MELEAELVTAALTMKEAVFCKSTLQELGFKHVFGGVPLFIEDTSGLHVAGNITSFYRAKHIALRCSFIQELVEDGTISIQYAKTQD